MAGASFHIVEVMSSPSFASKRIGYLAAAQSFSPTTDVLLLTTNQFKKDLTNGKLQDCSQALTCLAKLVTEELGRDLEKDVSLLLNHPRPYIRKKALLVLYRLIMVHPDTLPVVSAQFRERLADSDPGVICAAVTVTCELARSSPRSFLSLAPILYQLLTNRDSNNWMLIKIVKLMGVLTPLEPRLGKKLVEPLTTLMRTTRAKSLLYECCSCITAGLMDHPEAVELCAQRLVEFMDDSDQNLKYLGLMSMKTLLKAHPHLAVEHRDNILDCLDDEDPGIRMRALELIAAFVTKRTLRDISKILLRKLKKASGDIFSVPAGAPDGLNGPDQIQSSTTDQEASYRESLARELLRAGIYRRSSDSTKAGYEFLNTADDFAWYTTTVLGGLADIPLMSLEVRNLLGDQLLELTSRVEALRPISVKVAQSLLSARRNTSEDGVTHEETEVMMIDHGTKDSYSGNGTVNGHHDTKTLGNSGGDALLSPSLAGSTAWILGEYSELLDDHTKAAKILVSFPRRGLDANAQVRILTACMKIYASAEEPEAHVVSTLIKAYIKTLVNSEYAEVQERAWFFESLLEIGPNEQKSDLTALFEGKLVPVDHRAQHKIAAGGDLDLDKPLLDTGSDSLYSFLVKSIGGVEHADEDLSEDNDSLFKEPMFATATLSFAGLPASAESSLTSSNQVTSGFLNSLPSTENKASNPFYLGSSSKVPNSVHRDVGRQEVERANQYNYDPAVLSQETAAVLTEEKPAGLDLSDDEVGSSSKSPLHNRNLQGVISHGFDADTTVIPNTGKVETKKKKKKKKKGKDKGKKSKSTANGTETSLIDFDVPSSITGASSSKEASTPKHLADALLM